MHNTEFDNDFDDYVMNDNGQDGSEHSQQLQSFLQKVPDVESIQPRLALKSSYDEMLSVIEGSDQPHDLIKEAQAMMREFVATARAKCHEHNKGRKHSAIVS
jgi:hypothetical protein